MSNKMKKLIMLVSIVGLSYACNKDNPQPKPQENCNCGKIISDDVNDYSVVIRNSCTGNNKKFILYPGDWVTAYVGSDMCIEGANKW